MIIPNIEKHREYYNSKPWERTTWLGNTMFKQPFDLWIYQEIIYETKPDLIIECGTYTGGSAFYFASIFDLMKNGIVLTLDAVDRNPVKHDRVTYILGNDLDENVVKIVEGYVTNANRVMVILDSDHTKSHVLKELAIYPRFVTKGCYLVVEDTNLSKVDVLMCEGPEGGPGEAVDEFLKNNNDFVQDFDREKGFITFFPGGWLKKI